MRRRLAQGPSEPTLDNSHCDKMPVNAQISRASSNRPSEDNVTLSSRREGWVSALVPSPSADEVVQNLDFGAWAPAHRPYGAQVAFGG